MIALLDTSEDLDICAVELGCDVEQLFSPLTGFSDKDPQRMKAMDNGGFGGVPVKRFEALLERESHQRQMFRFVTAPDVVSVNRSQQVTKSARRTLELFDYWYPRLCQWPLALVAQNGQEDLPIPWDLIAAIFIGGDDGFKDSKDAADIIRTAQTMGKWTHVGRVNEPKRWQRCHDLGVDSVDGSGIARYSHMRIAIRDRKVNKQNGLFDSEQIASTEAKGLLEVVNLA